MKIITSKTYAVILSALIASCIFLSCEKEPIRNKFNSEKPINSDFTVKNGYIIFNSSKSFDQTLDGIANLSNEDRTIWEKSIGFKSQHRIINEIIEAEDTHDSICEIIYADTDIRGLDESVFHSDIYNKYLKKGIIKIMQKNTDDEYWDYSVFNRGFIDFINEDGLYAIGDTLYQVTEKYIKALKNSDFSKAGLLIQATENDESNSIYILHQVSSLKTYDGCPGLIETNWTSSGGGKSGEKRIKIGIFLDVRYYITSPTKPGYQFYNEAYVQCQERNWLRNWKYEFTNINVNGEWNIEVFSNSQSYGNSWTWSGSASYLKACINPESGSGAPYQSYFTVYCNNPSPFNMEESYYPPKFNSYNWKATRDGGCCGLNATLIK